MDYLLDTNILVLYIRRSNFSEKIDDQFAPLSPENTPIISVVSVGEIQSLAIQNNWGIKKWQNLEELLKKFLIADINIESIIARYAEIDAYSQNKLKSNPLGNSARNMGKNDLWIAATASVLNAKLLTTDGDFDHLKDQYIDLERIDLEKLKD